MNSPVCGLQVAGVFAGLGSLAHLLRLLMQFQIHIGSHSLPVWASRIAFVVLGLLSFWLWKLSLAAKLAVPTAPPAPPPAG
jgi:hypothetical protein